MALPRRKHSKARRDKSRTHWRLRVRSTTQCGQCGKLILPHRACRFCGTYRGRQVVAVAMKKDERPS